MIVCRKSHILLDHVDDDLVERIMHRLRRTLRNFIAIQEGNILAISWSEVIPAWEHVFLIEDITSIYCSLNIPA